MISESRRHDRAPASVDERRQEEATVTATPNPIPAGAAVGSTTITWQSGAASPCRIYVSEDGAEPILFAVGTEGSREVTWIQVGKTYEFQLFAGARSQAPQASVVVSIADESDAGPDAATIAYDGLSRDALIEEVKRVGPWFHQIDLGRGILTRDVDPRSGPQPHNHPIPRWDDVKDVLPRSLEGARVLDVGCADGYFSVEMARRHAREVVAIDEWSDMVNRVRFLRDYFRLPAIKPKTASVYDIGPRFGRFDMVLMLAVLYHLEHPLLGLQKIAAVTDLVYLETVTVDDDDNPYLFLRQPSETNTQVIPKWIPTRRCVRDMLTWVGFADIREISCGTDDRSMFVARK